MAGMIKDSIVDHNKNHNNFKEGNLDYQGLS